ncbi:MAG: hypothetical protein ACI9UR_000606 [Bacteroidia bacterium]|jgi:hypothetical protein
MCPSDIYQLPVTAKGFGPGAEVFASDLHHPCSIAVKDNDIKEDVRIQVQRDDIATWCDYEEGQLLIGKRIKCRIAYGGSIRNVSIEVFHT